MTNLEEFFKNRINFLPLSIVDINVDYPTLTPRAYYPIPTPRAYLSKNIFTPEEYTLELAKEKVKAFAYYLFGSLKFYLRHVDHWLMRIKFIGDYDDGRHLNYYFSNGGVKDIIQVGSMYFDVEISGGRYNENDFLELFDITFKTEEDSFSREIPLKRFRILIKLTNISEDDDILQKEIFQIINTNQIFKTDECVICLTNSRSVLFCNCGHIPICEECDKVKSLTNCPICKTETTIKRLIEY